MRLIGFELILFFVSFVFMQGSIKGHSYFWFPILLIIVSIVGLMKFKNERHSSLFVMAFFSSILTLANSKFLAQNAPEGFNKLVMIFNLFLVFSSGLVSFIYIHTHGQPEKKRKFEPKDSQDISEKINHYSSIGKKIIKLWKSENSMIGFILQLDKLFEKKEEENNSITFILGTEVDQDTDSYKYK